VLDPLFTGSITVKNRIKVFGWDQYHQRGDPAQHWGSELLLAPTAPDWVGSRLQDV